MKTLFFGRALRGFTLVELLVAMTILSLITGLIFGGLQFGTKVAGDLQSGVARTQRVHLVQRMLRKQLQHAAPMTKKSIESTGELAFEAKSDGIEFIATTSAGTGYSGLFRVRIGIEEDFSRGNGNKKLTLAYSALVPEDEFRNELPKLREVVVFENFSDGEFTYRDSAEVATDGWVSEWRNSRKLPALVRLSLRGAASRGDEWPDLIVALKATSPASVDE